MRIEINTTPNYVNRSSLLAVLVMLCSLTLPVVATHAASRPTALMTSFVKSITAGAIDQGEIPESQDVELTIGLPLRNEQDLDTLIQRIYTPGDQLYRQYLTSSQFADVYGADAGSYVKVKDYFTSAGFTVEKEFSNRLLLCVKGKPSALKNALDVSMHHYVTADGAKTFAATDTATSLPVDIAGHIASISGLNNYAAYRSHIKFGKAHGLTDTSAHNALDGNSPRAGLQFNGYGAEAIKTAYGLSSTTWTGAGQSVAVIEFDGYNASDIAGYVSSNAAYFNTYNSSYSAPLTNELAGASDASVHSLNTTSEVCLDIEMVLAMAPEVSNIYVYIGPYNANVSQYLTTLNDIATDDKAGIVSNSWGSPEIGLTTAELNQENAILEQMSVQGQTFLAASGDSGAYDNGGKTQLCVDDPGSQPYTLCCGGTTLVTSSNGAYEYETAWNNGYQNSERAYYASGGGVSSVWGIPSWQTTAAQSATGVGASTSHRNVPDVSLNADPDNWPYLVYAGGSILQGGVGGTSACAPLWAGYIALANQALNASSQPNIGYANATIYTLAEGPGYAAAFHDPFSGNNAYYSAGLGYDLATGWGSFNSSQMMSLLTTTSSTQTQNLSAGLNFFTVPFITDTQIVSLISSGYVGTVRGVAYYDTSEKAYQLSRNGTISQFDLGKAYWGKFDNAFTLSASAYATVPNAVQIPLYTGWNAIGDPYPAAVAVNNIVVDTGAALVPWTSAIPNPIWSTVYYYPTANSSGTYSTTGAGSTLQPYLGYWVYAFKPCSLIITNP